jgi:hypothetical protein
MKKIYTILVVLFVLSFVSPVFCMGEDFFGEDFARCNSIPQTVTGQKELLSKNIDKLYSILYAVRFELSRGSCTTYSLFGTTEKLYIKDSSELIANLDSIHRSQRKILKIMDRLEQIIQYSADDEMKERTRRVKKDMEKFSGIIANIVDDIESIKDDSDAYNPKQLQNRYLLMQETISSIEKLKNCRLEPQKTEEEQQIETKHKELKKKQRMIEREIERKKRNVKREEKRKRRNEPPSYNISGYIIGGIAGAGLMSAALIGIVYATKKFSNNDEKETSIKKGDIFSYLFTNKV